MEILKEHFFMYAMISGVLIAGLCAYLGVYIILKRIVFIGLALSEMAALGVALGLFLGWRAELAALFVAFLGVLFFWYRSKDERTLTNESIIGFVYVLSAALGSILISKNPNIEASGIDLLKGNILYTTTSDLVFLTAMTIIILPLHILLFKEFLFVSFDRETAHTTKLKTNLYEFILYLSIGITVALSMRAGGVIFVFGSLVIPPLVGLVLARKISFVFLFSVLVAVVSTVSGIFLSYLLDLPSSPTILCIYGLIFLLISFLKNFIR